MDTSQVDEPQQELLGRFKREEGAYARWAWGTALVLGCPSTEP